MIAKKIAYFPAPIPSETPYPRVMREPAKLPLASYQGLQESLAERYMAQPQLSPDPLRRNPAAQADPVPAQMTWLNEGLHRYFRQMAAVAHNLEREEFRRAWILLTEQYDEDLRRELWTAIQMEHMRHLQDRRHHHVIQEQARNLAAWLQKMEWVDYRVEGLDGIRLAQRKFEEYALERTYRHRIQLLNQETPLKTVNRPIKKS